jgi:hypothetical protein
LSRGRNPRRTPKNQRKKRFFAGIFLAGKGQYVLIRDKAKELMNKYVDSMMNPPLSARNRVLLSRNAAIRRTPFVIEIAANPGSVLPNVNLLLT